MEIDPEAKALPFGVEPLSPAYGRDYDSQDAALRGFDNGKEFVCGGGFTGPVTTKHEMADYFPKIELIRLRYNKQRDTCMAKLREPNVTGIPDKDPQRIRRGQI